MAACPECGAPAGACRKKFEAMLALEFQDPVVFGAVHHVTVICYNLQHPGAFSEEARAWMRSTLHAVIEESLSPAELRERSKKKFNGQVRVLSKAPKMREIKWSMTIMGVHDDSPDIYTRDIIAWAKSILKDLDQK